MTVFGRVGDAAENSTAGILGRGGQAALHDHPTAVHLKLVGELSDRARNVAGWQGIPVEEARELCRRIDRERADYVIFDTPSALAFTDTMSLARIMDGAYLCVRALEQLSGAEQRLVESLERSGVVVLGSILTNVPVSDLDGYQNYQRCYPAPVADDSRALPEGAMIVPVDDYDIEFRIVQPMGVVRWIHERGVVIPGKNGAPYRVSGISTDVTERRQAEDLLRRNEANLARAQRLSATGSFSYVAAADELTLSEETRRICGFDPAVKVSPAAMRDRIHPEDLPAARQTVERLWASQSSEGELRFLTTLEPAEQWAAQNALLRRSVPPALVRFS